MEKNIKKSLVDFLCGLMEEIKQMPRLEGHYLRLLWWNN